MNLTIDLSDFYEIDELENAIDYLEKTAEFYRKKDDKHRSKWLLISLHEALYSFGIVVLSCQNQLYVYEDNPRNKKSYKKLCDEYFKDFKDEKMAKETAWERSTKIISIWEVIKRCQNKKFVPSPIEINEYQCIALDELITFRNDFAHFKPSHMSVNRDYDIVILNPVCQVIKSLVLDSKMIDYRDQSQEDRVISALNTILK